MASPAFGFSVGDFVAGIKLVKDLILALNDGAGARPSYRRLIAELLHLDDALARVRSLHIVPEHASQKIALEQVAAQCQESIDEFLKKNAKFRATLGLQIPTKQYLRRGERVYTKSSGHYARIGKLTS